jgi:uncharacterized protein YciI
MARAYFVVTRLPAPAWDASRPMREQDGWPEHAAFMNGLAATGFIVLGGPVGDGQRFLHVCSAEDEDTVRSRFAEDPWEPGMLETASVEPWTILLDASAAGSR